MEITLNDFLGGKIRLLQYKNGYRITSDTVLLAAAVQAKKNETVLDVGTGTGGVLFCLHARIPELNSTGIEIQTDLYQLALKNQEINQYKIHFINEDIFSEKSTLHGIQFHHVVTNPPFYTEDLIRNHPQTATAYHQTFDLSRWLRFCLKHLRAKGSFTLIHRTEALPEILAILNKTALGGIEVIPIQAKVGSSSKRVIVRGIMGSKKPFVLRPPLVMHTETNERTELAEKIMREGYPIE